MQNVELLKTRYNRGKGGTKKMCVVLSNINIKGGIGKTIGNMKEAMEYGNSFSFIITFATFCDANDAL